MFGESFSLKCYYWHNVSNVVSCNTCRQILFRASCIFRLIFVLFVHFPLFSVLWLVIFKMIRVTYFLCNLSYFFLSVDTQITISSKKNVVFYLKKCLCGYNIGTPTQVFCISQWSLRILWDADQGILRVTSNILPVCYILVI